MKPTIRWHVNRVFLHHTGLTTIHPAPQQSAVDGRAEKNLLLCNRTLKFWQREQQLVAIWQFRIKRISAIPVDP